MGFFKLRKSDGGEKAAEYIRHDKVDKIEKNDLVVGTIAAGVTHAAIPETTKERSDKKHRKKDAEAVTTPAITAGNATTSTTGLRPGVSVNDFIGKTKNQQRQGLKPSGPELIAYARYLGIDPVADHDLLWIAVDALEAPLPIDWSEHFDSNDRVFYYNASKRESSWTHPFEHFYRDTYKQIVNFRNTNMLATEREDRIRHIQKEVELMEQEVQKFIAQWSEHVDDHGNRFYFNREERQSTWTDPRPAKCQLLYLKMRMVRLMQSSSGSAGFIDENADNLSRFAPGSGTDFEDPALKRPKVGHSSGDFAFNSEHLGANSPSSPGSRNNSGSESNDERKSLKKKKHKKKKRHNEGGSHNLCISQSEASLHHSTEGLSTVGRAKVKAGIRLEPLAPVAAPLGVRNSASVPLLQT